MQKLIDGIHRFQRHIFSSNREFYERLARDGQSPAALFITCADSRVNPNLITQTEPGELMILRNAGNIIPPHGAPVGGEAASIELAVSVLGVSDIVVCGHSHCGAMEVLLGASADRELPAVRAWLAHAETVRKIIRERYGHLQGTPLLTATAQENVLVQMEHLYTHPSVVAACSAGRLRIHGWMYKFETGEVFSYDVVTSQFAPVRAPPTEPATRRITRS